MTTAPPLSWLKRMISSLLNRSLIASFSLLSRFVYGHLGLKGLVLLISFLKLQQLCQRYDDFCLVPNLFLIFFGVQVFLFTSNILFSSSVSLLIESLKCVFSFISLNKLFKSLSNSFLLFTFWCIYKSLYSLFEKVNAVS